LIIEGVHLPLPPQGELVEKRVKFFNHIDALLGILDSGEQGDVVNDSQDDVEADWQ
jgi:hypothetical protein